MEIVSAVLPKWRKNSRHVVVDQDEAGRPIKVDCLYKSRVYWEVADPCPHCGRPMDRTTFVTPEQFKKHDARIKALWEARRKPKLARVKKVQWSEV